MKNYQVDALRFSAAQNALKLLLDETPYRKIELFRGSEDARWQYEFLHRLVDRGILARSGKPRHPMQRFFAEDAKVVQDLLDNEEELKKILWPKAQQEPEPDEEDSSQIELPLGQETEEPENDHSGQLIAAFTLEIQKLHAVIEAFDERLTHMDGQISESSNKVDALHNSIEALAAPVTSAITQETSPIVAVVSTALNKITEMITTSSSELSKNAKWMEKRFDQEAAVQTKERKDLKASITDSQQRFYKMQHTNFDSLVKVMDELCEIALEKKSSSPFNKIMIASITDPKKSEP